MTVHEYAPFRNGRLANKIWQKILFVTVLVFTIGVAWEIFEYVYDLQGDKIDTAWDLIMDSLGVIAAYLLTARSREFS